MSSMTAFANDERITLRLTVAAARQLRYRTTPGPQPLTLQHGDWYHLQEQRDMLFRYD